MRLAIRSLSVAIFMSLFLSSTSQATRVDSTRYAPAHEGMGTELLLAGESTLLEWIEVNHDRLAAGEVRERSAGEELLYLVQTGRVSVTIGTGVAQEIGPGSIVLVMPGDRHVVANSSDATASYFVMRYRAKAPSDAMRGSEGGGSIVVDFETLKFKPHDRGGLRNYFDRPTTMTGNFEMHVTTLNEGITSHPPHTHGAEEIILMIHGEAEELIDGEPHALKAGELVFLDSMVPHGIRNTGSGTCMYFAFQWR